MSGPEAYTPPPIFEVMLMMNGEFREPIKIIAEQCGELWEE